MSEIAKMLKEKASMPLNEFHAAACAMIPSEATRYGKISRFTLVLAWMRNYAKHYVIQDGRIEFCNGRKHSGLFTSTKGHDMLLLLKEKGRITQEESGFKKVTWNCYRQALRRLGWVRYENSHELIWCGPDNAEWRAVTRENNRHARKAKQDITKRN